MIANYIKLSYRKFKRQKFYSLLNIGGLATGMATVLLILLYVLDELSFDKFHQDSERLYRVVENQYYTGQPVFPVAVTPGPLAPSLKYNFGEIEYASRANFTRQQFHFGDSKFEDVGLYVDPDFLKMFTFPIIRGDRDAPLKELNSVAITQALALKLFGNDEPVGKIIEVNNREVVVTAVLQDTPANSHINFSFLMPMEYGLTIMSHLESWSTNALYTYVKLVEETSAEDVNEKIKSHIEKNNNGSDTEIYLQPLTDIYLSETSFTADLSTRSSKQYVRIFSIVAAFILIIACINFMNLSTARAMKRAKEVGLRKTIGAQRYQLIFQFLGESVMVAMVSMAIALLIVDLFLNPFNALTQKNLQLNFNSNLLPLALIATVLTGILAGSYPAIFLSSFMPAKVLKGTLTKFSGGSNFRQILVVTQFCVSIIMISGTLVVSEQIDFIRSKNLGYQKENVINVKRMSNQYEVFKNKLLAYPEIESVSGTDQHPAYVFNSTGSYVWPGKSEDQSVLIHNQGVEYDYVETMKMNVVQGRSFSKDYGADSASIILNEEAVQVMNLKNPIGTKIKNNGKEHTVIGVVQNFHFKSFHDKIEPIILYLNNTDHNLTMVRVNGDVQKTVKAIEAEWKKLNPEKDIVYSFLDEDFDNLYRAESQTGTIFKFFSTLAILISSLGLFGLASYTVDQKSKEYGIRKVFGASVSRLFYSASRDFLLLVIIAFIISLPIAWMWMNSWLNSFSYHINLSYTIFIISGLLSVAIAIVTVSYQAFKVAYINPAKTLRSE